MDMTPLVIVLAAIIIDWRLDVYTKKIVAAIEGKKKNDTV
jgi:hypothetical protein